MSNVFRFVGGPLDGRLQALESAPLTVAMKYPLMVREVRVSEGAPLPDPCQAIEVGEVIYQRAPGRFVDDEWRIPHTYNYVEHRPA